MPDACAKRGATSRLFPKSCCFDKHKVWTEQCAMDYLLKINKNSYRKQKSRKERLVLAQVRAEGRNGLLESYLPTCELFDHFLINVGLVTKADSFVYFTIKQKQKLVEKAIPNIADAIKTVVSLSKNEDFKIKCFNLTKVSFYRIKFNNKTSIWSLNLTQAHRQVSITCNNCFPPSSGQRWR